MLTSPKPGVPLNKERVMEMAHAAFPEGKPKHISWTFHVVAASPTDDINGRQGSLFRLSPEECSHAVLFLLEEAVLRSAGETTDEISAWGKVLLTCPFLFELLPTAWTLQDAYSKQLFEKPLLEATFRKSCL